MEARPTSLSGCDRDRDHEWCRVRAALTDVLHDYAAVIDARQWSDLDAIFLPDAVADLGELGGEVAGRDAISAHCASALERFAATQHLIGNVRITSWDGHDATTACSFVAVHVTADGSSPFLVGGTYRDLMRRGPDGWRISRRHLHVIWRGGREPGSLFPGGGLAGGGRRESKGPT